MSSLFGTLHTASTALDVYSRALGNEEANVANASTEGYAALRSRISTIGPNGPLASTGDYISVTSAGELHTDALVRAATSQSAGSSTLEAQLTPLIAVLDVSGETGILGSFQKFTSAFSKLAITPNDGALQSAAVDAAGAVASQFRKAAGQVGAQRASADANISSTLQRINQLSSQIRGYNLEVRAGAALTSGTDANLRNALDELSSLIDIGVSYNFDGTVSVLAAQQQPLVLGDQAYTLGANLSQPEGSQIASSGGGASAAHYGGALGALLDFRNETVGKLIGGDGHTGSLNELAKGFASRVNALLSAGVTASGSAGAPIFTWDQADDTKTAGSLVVDPAFAVSQLALGSGTASNGTADALAKLIASRSPGDTIQGQSAQDFLSGIAGGIGRQLADTRDLVEANSSALTSAQSVRTSRSGVSLDQEAVLITAYQRAYQANAKVISIINDLAGEVVNLIR